MWMEVLMMERRDKVNYYLDLADVVSQRGTCLRKRYGAVIVKNDEVIATGYVGAPRGRKNCTDINRCIREEMKIPSVMNCAAVCMRKRMRLSAQSGKK